jgi:hypothetical protein
VTLYEFVALRCSVYVSASTLEEARAKYDEYAKRNKIAPSYLTGSPRIFNGGVAQAEGGILGR